MASLIFSLSTSGTHYSQR